MQQYYGPVTVELVKAFEMENSLSVTETVDNHKMLDASIGSASIQYQWIDTVGDRRSIKLDKYRKVWAVSGLVNKVHNH